MSERNAIHSIKNYAVVQRILSLGVHNCRSGTSIGLRPFQNLSNITGTDDAPGIDTTAILGDDLHPVVGAGDFAGCVTRINRNGIHCHHPPSSRDAP